MTFILAIFTQSLINQLFLINSNKQSLTRLVFDFALSLTIYAVIIMLYLALIQFIISFFHREMDIRTVLSISGLSFAPIFLCLPVSIITTIWISPSSLLFGLVSFLVFLWITILFFSGIKETYSLSFWQLILVIFSPVLLGLLFLAIFLLAATYIFLS